MNLIPADLHDAILHDANLTHVKFGGTLLADAKIVGTTLNTKSQLLTALEGAQISASS